MYRATILTVDETQLLLAYKKGKLKQEVKDFVKKIREFMLPDDCLLGRLEYTEPLFDVDIIEI